MTHDDNLFEERKKAPEEVFTRYNREERLKNAPEQVKAMYEGNFIPQRGILKSLTATRGLRAVLFAIVILVVINLVLFAINRDKSSGKIHNIKIEVNTFIFDGIPLANLKMQAYPEFIKQTENKTEQKKDSSKENIGEVVKVQFSFFDKDENKISSTIKTGIYNGTEQTFSARDESMKAKSVEVHILMKEKLVTLTKRIND